MRKIIVILIVIVALVVLFKLAKLIFKIALPVAILAGLVYVYMTYFKKKS